MNASITAHCSYLDSINGYDKCFRAHASIKSSGLFASLQGDRGSDNNGRVQVAQPNTLVNKMLKGMETFPANLGYRRPFKNRPMNDERTKASYKAREYIAEHPVTIINFNTVGA